MAFNTADEYRAEIARLKAAVQEQGTQAVRAGYITEDEFRSFAGAVDALPEDPEVAEARAELEAYQLRLQQATRSFLPNGKRDRALELIGCPVPTARVGRLS